jgi:hypothetical protein
MGPPGRYSREVGMKWRVMLELIGPDGIVGVHEVGGRAAVAEHAPRSIGLTLEEGKHLLPAQRPRAAWRAIRCHVRFQGFRTQNSIRILFRLPLLMQACAVEGGH